MPNHIINTIRLTGDREKMNLKKSTGDSTPWDIRCSEVICCRYPMWW